MSEHSGGYYDENDRYVPPTQAPGQGLARTVAQPRALIVGAPQLSNPNTVASGTAPVETHKLRTALILSSFLTVLAAGAGVAAYDVAENHLPFVSADSNGDHGVGNTAPLPSATLSATPTETPTPTATPTEAPKPTQMACITELSDTVRAGQRVGLTLSVDVLPTSTALLDNNHVGYVTVTPSAAKKPKVSKSVITTLQKEQTVPVMFVPDSNNKSPAQINAKATLPAPAIYGAAKAGSKTAKALNLQLKNAMAAIKAEGFTGVPINAGVYDPKATPKEAAASYFSDQGDTVANDVKAYVKAAKAAKLIPILTGWKDGLSDDALKPFLNPTAGTDISLASVSATTIPALQGLGYKDPSLFIGQAKLPEAFSSKNSVTTAGLLNKYSVIELQNADGKTAVTATELQTLQTAIIKAELTNWKSAVANILGQKSVDACAQLTASQISALQKAAA